MIMVAKNKAVPTLRELTGLVLDKRLPDPSTYADGAQITVPIHFLADRGVLNATGRELKSPQILTVRLFKITVGTGEFEPANGDPRALPVEQTIGIWIYQGSLALTDKVL